MNKKQVKEMIKLVRDTRHVYVTSLDNEGYPHVKCVFLKDYEGLTDFYISLAKVTY